jgi:hypothetical protein
MNESGPGPEKQPQLIERLPAELGFIESDELIAIRHKAVEAVRTDDWPLIHRLRSQYMQLGEEIVERFEGIEFEKAKIGLTVATSLIMLDGGRQENYAGELQNAHLHALNVGLDDKAAVIEAALAAAGLSPEYRPLNPSRENPKREISVDYRSQLQALVANFEPLENPLNLSLDDNRLLVDGRSLGASDGPAVLWHALTDNREVIDQGLQSYRSRMQNANPDKVISNDIPLRLMYLADHPRDVLTSQAMEKIDHSLREFHDIEDVREEFRELWQAVDASGRLAEIRMFATRSGWDKIYLWARSQST